MLDLGRTSKIEKWMLSIVQNGGIERFDDLHLDQIDEVWKSKELWLKGGLVALDLASDLRTLHSLPYTVALGISLTDSMSLVGRDSLLSNSILEQFDWTPPSLYLFNPDNEPYRDSLIATKVDLAEVSGRDIYYLEFVPSIKAASEDKTYTRSLFVCDEARHPC